MNIVLAQTFLEVVATGSFVRAADRLHVTHSAITMRIKALEDLLGKPLLIRSKTGVSVTADGARFHRHAEAMVRAWQLMKRQMSLAPGLDSILSVGVDTNIFQGFTARWISQMRERHPDIAIRCENADSERLMQLLFQGWINFCLTTVVRSRDGIKFMHIFDDPLILVSTEDRGWRDWDPYFIEIDWGESYRSFTDNHFDMADKTPVASVSQFSAGLELVQELGGSTWMPERFYKSQKLAKPMYPVRGVEMIPRPIYLAYSIEAVNSKYSKLSLEKFSESVLETVNWMSAGSPVPPVAT